MQHSHEPIQPLSESIIADPSTAQALPDRSDLSNLYPVLNKRGEHAIRIIDVIEREDPERIYQPVFNVSTLLKLSLLAPSPIIILASVWYFMPASLAALLFVGPTMILIISAIIASLPLYYKFIATRLNKLNLNSRNYLLVYGICMLPILEFAMFTPFTLLPASSMIQWVITFSAIILLASVLVFIATGYIATHTNWSRLKQVAWTTALGICCMSIGIASTIYLR